MLIVSLHPTERAERYCKRDSIEIIRLETVLQFISRYMDTRKKIETVNIKFDIDCRKEDSEYNFSSKLIVIAGISWNDKKIKTRKGRIRYLIEHLVHEFRHCMQEVLFNKDTSDVTYESTKDSEYDKNPLEVDAYWFEKKFSKKAVDLYFALKKAKVKDVKNYHG